MTLALQTLAFILATREPAPSAALDPVLVAAESALRILTEGFG
jgi:hypothetical protein